MHARCLLMGANGPTSTSGDMIRGRDHPRAWARFQDCGSQAAVATVEAIGHAGPQPIASTDGVSSFWRFQPLTAPAVRPEMM